MNFDENYHVKRNFSKIVVFLSWTHGCENMGKLFEKLYFIGVSKSLYHFVTVLSTNGNNQH